MEFVPSCTIVSLTLVSFQLSITFDSHAMTPSLRLLLFRLSFVQLKPRFDSRDLFDTDFIQMLIKTSFVHFKKQICIFMLSNTSNCHVAQNHNRPLSICLFAVFLTRAPVSPRAKLTAPILIRMKVNLTCLWNTFSYECTLRFIMTPKTRGTLIGNCLFYRTAVIYTLF